MSKKPSIKIVERCSEYLEKVRQSQAFMVEYEALLAKMETVPDFDRSNSLRECVRLLDDAQKALVDAALAYRSAHGESSPERNLWLEVLMDRAAQSTS